MPSTQSVLLLAASLVALESLPRAAAQEAPPSPRRIDVLDSTALARAMEEISSAHPSDVTTLPVGTSRGGRRIDALRVGRGKITPGRPAILVVAALDVELAWTSDLVLDHARELVARAESDEETRTFLETTTLYLVPRANPDAAENRTGSPRGELRATAIGVDDDRDGRNGEDGPADVDGDGVIGWMRVLDPEGEWIEDPTDPRVLVKADASKGQRGRWKLLLESRDSDGDGEAGEDPPNDASLNRNFPQGWVEHASESGRYPTEFPEARALADFVLLHPDIALVVTYGMLDGLGEKPKVKEDGGRRSANPSDGIPAADADLYAELGRRWKALGGTSTKNESRDAGTFQAWIQAQRGLWTVNIAPWSVPLDEKPADKKAGEKGPADKEPSDKVPADKDVAKSAEKPADSKKSDEPKPSDDAKRLRWFDARAESNGFRPWTRIEHPDFDHVEVGGFAPFALYEPPPETRAEIADEARAFLVDLGSVLPRVTAREVSARSLGADTWRIEAVIANESLLPLQSALAKRTRSVRPARVRLEFGEGAALVAGPREELVSDLAGSGGRRELAWIVRAPSVDRITLVVDTDSAGSIRVVPEAVR